MKNNCLQTIKASQGRSFHDADINVFGMHHERPLVISGDLQGKVYFSHYQTGEVGSLIGDHTDSVETIAFSKSHPICVSAGIDTHINIYDLTRTELRNKIEPTEYGGYSKVQFSQNHHHILFAANTLGDFHAIDVRDGKVVKTYRGNTGPINDFVEVKPLEIVVTAGEDRECRVFDIRGLN
jgi:WD40 repeat protein